MKNFKPYLLTILSTTLLFSVNLSAKDTVKAELRTLWQKAYGGSSRDKAYGVVGLKDGGAFVVGGSKSYGKGREDMLVVRFDKSGKTIHRSSYGGKQQDVANSVTATSDGFYMAAGFSKSFSKNNDKDVYLVKFDIDGKRLWQKSYGGDEDDEATSIVATNGGGALITGYTESYGKGYKDVYIIYVDKDGKEIWSKAIGGSDDDFANAITLSSDGGFYVAGATRSFGEGGFDFYLLKFDGDGKFIFKKVYGEREEDIIYAITATRDGGCVVAGSTKSFGSKQNDIDVIRYSKDGAMKWHKIYGFKSKEWVNSITRTDEGGFLLAGTTKSFGFGAQDFYMIELDSKGSSLWANVYGGDVKDIAHGVARMSDGSYMVVGETESFGNGDYDFMIMKLSKK